MSVTIGPCATCGFSITKCEHFGHNEGWPKAMTRIAALERQLAEAQGRGDGYKGESEVTFARARRSEIERDRYKALAERLEEALEMAVDTIELDQEVPRPAGKMQAWVAKYGDVTDTEILRRIHDVLAELTNR